MPTNNTIGITKYSSQYIDNLSFDEDYKVSVTEVVTENVAGTALVRQKPIATEETLAANYATKVTVSGLVTYVGKAAIGSAQASAVWQAKKIDETTGVVITFADGNASFDNVATDLTSLSYS